MGYFHGTKKHVGDFLGDFFFWDHRKDTRKTGGVFDMGRRDENLNHPPWIDALYYPLVMTNKKLLNMVIYS